MISANNASLPLCSAQPLNYSVPFRLWASLSLVRPPRAHQLCWMNMMEPTVDEQGENYKSKDGLSIDVSIYIIYIFDIIYTFASFYLLRYSFLVICMFSVYVCVRV